MGGFSQWEIDSAQATKDLATDVSTAAKPYVQNAAEFWNDAKAMMADPDAQKAEAATFWADAKQQQAAKLQQSVSYSATQNPDEYAKNLRLGQQMGVSPELAKDYHADLEQAAATSRMNYLNFSQQNPRTTGWASDPQNAAVAGVDEIHRVGAIEQSADFIRALTPKQEFESKYVKPLEKAIFSFPLARAGIEMLKGTEQFAANVGVRFGLRENALQQAAESLSPERFGSYQKPEDVLAQQLGPLVATYPIGVAGRVLTAAGMSAEAASVATGLATGAAFTAEQSGATYTAMKQRGATEEQAWSAANKVALVNAPFQALFGFTHILPQRAALRAYTEMIASGESEAAARTAASRAAILGGVLPSVGVGGLTGAAGQVGQNWITGRPTTEDVGKAALTGAMTQAGMHLGMGFFEQMANVIAHTDQSQLKVRSPQQFKQAMQAVFDGQESLRIPVEQFETYFQSQNMDPAAVAASLGVQNYAEAKTGKTDVEVPTPDFLAKLDREHQEALLPDIKDPVTNMTFNQTVKGQQDLEEWRASGGPEKLREMTEAATKDVDAETAATPEYQQVKQELKKRFMDAGDTEPIAEANATLQANVHSYLARETGMKPTEVLAITNPRIRVGEAPMDAMAQSAFHGSPYQFDRFTLEHLGTGEGAQAFGHGLYFASNKAIAEYYRKGLSYQKIVKQFRDALPDNADTEEALEAANSGELSKPMADVIHALAKDDWLGYDYPAQAITAAFRELDQHDPSPELRAAVQKYGGQLYEADIPNDEHMLHWDEPLNEQPEAVSEGLKQSGLLEGADKYFEANGKTNPTGEDLHNFLIYSGYQPEEISRRLNEAGVKGTKYLDATSRAAGEGSHNYVVFDDNAIKILNTFYQGPVDQARAEDRQWRNWEPESTSTGKIKGAPENVNNRKDLNAMRGRLRRLVQEGLAGRFWYEQSAQAVMKMVGGDIQKAEKFMQLLAIYSPNSNVWVNTLQAVRAYTHWAAGRPESEFSVGSERADKNATQVLYHDTPWEGRKTNSFYLNLMHDIVQNYPEEVSKLNLDPAFVTSLSKPATIDVWMGRAFEYENTSFTDDKGSGKYSFSENEVRRLTAELNSKLSPGEERWTPHQVQAAIWTAMKTRYEMPEVKARTMVKSIREGLVTIGDKGPVYPSTAEGKRAHYANWHRFAMEPTSAEARQLSEEQARSFGDDMERLTQTVTWEANPSKSLGLDISKASPEVQRMFTAVARGLLMGPKGEDLLAHMLGVPLSYGTEGHGAFEGDVSPNILSHLLPARAEGQEGFNIDEVRAYARAIQYIYKQDAVPWFRAENKGITSVKGAQDQKFRVTYPNGKTKKLFDTQAEAEIFARDKGAGFIVTGGDLARAVVLHFAKTLDSDKLNDVLKSLQKYLGKDAGFTRTADNEIMVVNFRDDQTKVPFARTDEDFLDAVGTFFDDKAETHGIAEHKKAWVQGEYGNVHDWSSDQEGQGLLNSRGLSGRPDLQAWLRDRRDAFDSLLKEYSGENLVKLEDAAKELYAQPSREPGPAQPSTEPGTTPGGGTLYQAGEQRPRGWITVHPDGSVEIGKTPRGDLSTYSHEFAHAYMKVLENLTKREGASDVIKGDYQKILDFLGAKAGEPLTVDQHEMWARANEQFLREGKAPNKSMRGVFQRFAVWLSSIYKKATDLGVELTPEIREVLGRFYAGDEAVDKAEQESGPQQFNSPEEAGWTPEQFAKYAESRGMEADQARAEIMSKLNAAALRDRTDAWQEEEQAVRAAKTDEIDARPEYQAIRALRKGEIGDGEEAQPLTLNKDELVRQFGEERVKALQEQHRGLYRLEGGTDAQTAAEMLGYSSGEELIQTLESTPRRRQAIERETRQYMTAKHGDIRYDGSLEDKARVALENDQRADRLHKELTALQAKLDALKEKVAGQKAAVRAVKIAPIQAYRDTAHAMVEAKPVVDLQPMRYLEASRKYSREAFDAGLKGKVEEAAAAKHKELINHFLYREAVKAKEFISDFEAYTKRAQGKQFQQTLGKAGGDYRAQFNGLMVRYGLMQGQAQPTGLAAFAQAQYDLMKEPAIDPALMDETRILNYKHASVSEVRIVNEALKNIRKLANQELGMIVNGRKVVFANAVAEMAARARAKNKVTPERVFQRNATVGERAVNKVEQGDATLLPAERLIEMLDGGRTGPWRDNLWNLAADSQGAEEAMNAEVHRAVEEVFERMPKEQRHSMSDKFRLAGIGEEVSRHQLVSMAFNVGNEGNLDRLVKTFEHHGWDPDVLNQLKDGLLSREDWQFVQDQWDVIKPVGEKSFAFEERMNGIPPVKVKPEPFTVKLPGGEKMELAGGYYPIDMDPRFSNAGAIQEASTTAQGLMQPGYTRATTSKGFLKERTGYGGPLRLDYEQTLTQHLAKVIKDITHREFVLAANKLLTDPTVRRALRETMGGQYEKQMLPWLRTIINDRNGSATQGLDLISDSIRVLRKNTILASIGFKMGTNILQVLHAPRMMLYTRPGAYLQALADFLTGPREFSQQVREMSPNEMASRGMHTDRDLREMMQAMSGEKEWYTLAGARDRAVMAGMATFKYIDQMLSFPLWMSVYRDGLVEHGDLAESEAKYQAMQAADRAVRLGLGAHSPKDLAPIMRNSDVGKLITVLYGFHSGVYGQMRAMGHELRYDGVKGIPKFTYGMLMAAIIPSMLSNLVRGKGPDKKESVGKWAALGALMYSLETIPLVRDFVSAVEYHKDVKISPLVDVLDKGARLAQQVGSGKASKDLTGLGLNALELGGTLGGIPGTAQVIKPMRYYHKAHQGKVSQPNLYDAFIGSGKTH